MRTILTLLLFGLSLKALPQIVKAEYFFDNAAVAYGQGISLTVPSNTGDVQITSDLLIAGLSPGFHQVFFRVKDAVKGWSQLTPKVFIKPWTLEKIVGFQYCIDPQPGTGTWTYRVFPVPSTDVSMDLQLDLGTISKGIHYFEAMARSTGGTWTAISRGTFFNLNAAPLDIIKLEYYLEPENGVAGSLFSVKNFTHSPNVTLDSVTFSVPVSSLENQKKYYVYIRAIDEAGNRSFYMKDTIVYHSITTGIKDQIYITPELIIFPNPVSEMVNFKFVTLDNPGEFIIRVFDENGRIVVEKEFSFINIDHYTLNASGLVPGIYRIAITTTGGKPLARATFMKK